MTAKAKPTPEPVPLVASDPDGATVTPPDLDAPTTSTPPDASTPPVDDSTGVTMADVAALNGVGIAPDESPDAPADKPPFISAGMASDLEQQGWCVDPNTGKKIVKE